MDWRTSSSIASSPEADPRHSIGMSSSAAGDDEMDGDDQQRSPKGGRVNRVCRNWLVHEDSALAYRLQAQEIEMHYGQNRKQRQTVRTDFQQAKHLQVEEDEDAVVVLKTQDEILTEQELEDERLALELQEQIEREEALHNRILEQADKEMARKLQETEARRGQRIKPKEEVMVGSAHRGRESHQENSHRSRESLSDSSRRSRESLLDGSSSPSKNLASCYEDTLSRAARNWTIESAPVPRHRGAVSPIDGRPPSRGERGQSPQCVLLTGVSPVDDYRRVQEVKDEELALELQESESQLQHNSQYYRDQQLAIEAQDRELAKLLQEKERRRAKKARQKAKSGGQKTDSELGAESEPHVDQETGVKVKPKRTAPNFHPPESRIPSQGDGHARMLGGGGVTATCGPRHGSGSRSDRPHHSGHNGSHMSHDEESLTNIAIALDPTYKNGYASPERKSSREATYATAYRNGVSPSQEIAEEENYYSDEDDPAVPPYMPIQGQKRQTLEKQRKKDGCKQQ